MDNLRYFATDEEYDLIKDNIVYPTVCWVEETDEVFYSPVPPPPPHDYSLDYFTIEVISNSPKGDNVVGFAMPSSKDELGISSMSYSIDGGETWETVSNVLGEDTYCTITPNVGDKILFKSVSTSLSWCYFGSNCTVSISGNIMSLLYGDNYIGQTSFPSGSESTFARIFSALSDVVSVEHLILPATTLVANCYSELFSGFASITTAPALPATTLAESCYNQMFYGCTALTTAPVLPATTLASSCYSNMFQGCIALASVPQDMLPATTLAESCYYQMFERCISLTTAPDLPALTLVDYCYYEMFSGCSRLRYVKALFTTTPGGTYTSNWLSGAETKACTFVKNSAATWNVSGTSGIPKYWTVEYYTIPG